MKKQHLITIRGAKGKGGGGSTFEADDNMFARQSTLLYSVLKECARDGPRRRRAVGKGWIPLVNIQGKGVGSPCKHTREGGGCSL